MADQTLFNRPTLATPPADADFTWVTDVSDLTDGANGTDKKQPINTHRTFGDTQVETFNNVATLGPNGADLLMDFISPAVFFRIRDNSNANILSVTETGSVLVEKGNLIVNPGDLNITAGDIIVQAGSVDIQAGTLDVASDVSIGGDLDMASGVIINATGLSTPIGVGMFTIINFNVGGVSMTGAAPNVYSINVDEIQLKGSGTLINELFGVEIRTSASDPVLADISAGYHTVWKNTTTGETSNYINDSGAILRSFPFNYQDKVSFSPTVIDTGAGTYTIGTSDAVYDVHANKAYLSIELININTVVAPSGTFRISNLPFSFVRNSPIDVAIFDGGNVNFHSIAGRVVNNGGNAEIEFTIQDAVDANFNTILGPVIMGNGNISIGGFMYI